jgi:hypothetical protein
MSADLTMILGFFIPTACIGRYIHSFCVQILDIYGFLLKGSYANTVDECWLSSHSGSGKNIGSDDYLIKDS